MTYVFNQIKIAAIVKNCIFEDMNLLNSFHSLYKMDGQVYIVQDWYIKINPTLYVKTFRTKVKKAMRPSREHVKQSIKEFRSLIDWIFTHDYMLL